MGNQEQTKEIKTLKEPSKKKKKPKFTLRKVLSSIVLVFIVLALIGSASSFIYVKSVLDKAPEIELDKITNKEGSKIFFEDGTLLASLAAFERENITFDELGHDLIDAFLAIEDARFFSHNGFDLPRFSRAFLNNLKRGDLGEGASTFSMQLVDNAYETFFSEMIYTPFYDAVEEQGLTSDSFQYKKERLLLNVRKINAKILEIGMAIELEKMISKQQIIENYLNKIYFGAGTSRGVQNAALYFFNKNAGELSLVESAFLAGVINAPSAFNPWANLDKAKSRTDEVLYQMKYHGYLTNIEYELALKVNLEDLLVDPENLGIFDKDKYITVINTVVAEAESLGYYPLSTPMHIYTSIRKDVQDTIEAIEAEETSIKYPNELMESAIVSLENNTGRIVGIGGGRKTALLGYNRATESNFQPGSTVKPILSYALAFEYLGWSTSHVVEDKPAYYGGTSLQLQNFDRRYRGEVTLLSAVANSYNLPAYLTLEEIHDKVGSGKIREYLSNLGFRESTVAGYNLQYSIGGSSFEVSPLELAAAHSVMYSGGNYITPHIIDKIDLNEGEPYEAHFVKVQALSKEAAYLTSRLTKYNVDAQIGNWMNILKKSYPVFAKTGTSDYDSSGAAYGIPAGASKEKWMMASTSKYTTAVWIGFDKPVKGKTTYYTDYYSSLNIPGYVNRLLLNVLEEGQPKFTDISRPTGVVSIEHILGTYPYAAPIEGMDKAYLASGLIKKENAVLSTLVDEDVIEDITDFNIVLGEATTATQTLAFSFAPYSGSIGIDDKYELKLGNSVKAIGKRLFLPSWLYGGVNYKVDVYDASNRLLETFSFVEPNAQVTINITPGETLKVCGYFGYATGEKKGGEICHEIHIENQSLVIPDFTSMAEVDSFISEYTLTNWVKVEEPAQRKGQIGTLKGAYRNDTLINNTEISFNDLNLATKVVTFKDKDVTIPSGKTFAEVKTWGNSLGVTISSDTLAETDEVTSLKVNDVTYNSDQTIKLSALVNVIAQ